MNIDKVLKKLPPAVIEVMDAMGATDLQQAVVQSEEAIHTATEELEANPKYQAVCEAKKDLSAGLRDLKSYQRAKIAYALHLLREKGAANAG